MIQERMGNTKQYICVFGRLKEPSGLKGLGWTSCSTCTFANRLVVFFYNLPYLFKYKNLHQLFVIDSSFGCVKTSPKFTLIQKFDLFSQLVQKYYKKLIILTMLTRQSISYHLQDTRRILFKKEKRKYQFLFNLSK